jgi:hypothetical protein
VDVTKTNTQQTVEQSNKMPNVTLKMEIDGKNRIVTSTSRKKVFGYVQKFVKERNDVALQKFSGTFMNHKWNEEKRSRTDQDKRYIELFVRMIREEAGQEICPPFSIISIGMPGLNGVKCRYIAKNVLKLDFPSGKVPRKEKYSRIWNSLETILLIQKQELMANYVPFPSTTVNNNKNRIHKQERTGNDIHDHLSPTALSCIRGLLNKYPLVIHAENNQIVMSIDGNRMSISFNCNNQRPIMESLNGTQLPSNANNPLVQQQQQQQQQHQEQEQHLESRGMNERTGEQQAQTMIRQPFETRFTTNTNTNRSLVNVQPRIEPERRSPQDNIQRAMQRTSSAYQRMSQSRRPSTRLIDTVTDPVVSQRGTSSGRSSCRILQRIRKSLRHR